MFFSFLKNFYDGDGHFKVFIHIKDGSYLWLLTPDTTPIGAIAIWDINLSAQFLKLVMMSVTSRAVILNGEKWLGTVECRAKNSEPWKIWAQINYNQKSYNES